MKAALPATHLQFPVIFKYLPHLTKPEDPLPTLEAIATALHLSLTSRHYLCSSRLRNLSALRPAWSHVKSPLVKSSQEELT